MSNNNTSPANGDESTPVHLTPCMEDILRWSHVLIMLQRDSPEANQSVVELRALKVPNGTRTATATGQYDAAERLAEDAERASAAGAPGVYFALNPVRRRDDLPLNEAVRAGVGGGSEAKDILRRHLLLIDFDTVRKEKGSSTDAEKEGARQKMDTVKAYLSDQGWPAPIQADSGNGFHLLYRIDLANDTEASATLRGVLDELDVQFSDEAVKIDTVVHDAPRICKFYGTISRKGDHTEQRPHRVSRLIDVPEPFELVPKEKLDALAEGARLRRLNVSAASVPQSINGGAYTTLSFRKPPRTEEEVRVLLKKVPIRPGYDEWIKIVAAVMEAVGDEEVAERLLKEWSPEEKSGEYAEKLRSPLERVTRDYLSRYTQAMSDGRYGPKIVEAGPQIPAAVYDSLPSKLRGALEFFEEGEARDVLLTGMLPVLAAMTPNVRVPHADGSYGIVFYHVILARAGAGKGKALWGPKLGNATERRYIRQYTDQMATYRAQPKVPGRQRGIDPDAPVLRSLRVEANISSAELLQKLSRNQGYGVMVASEIDAASGALGQDWGGHSDILRAGWHNESVGAGRIEGGVRIEFPNLSIMMTGTAEQFPQFVPKTQNGLYSRITVYMFDPEVVWKSHRPGPKSEEREKYFDDLSEWLDKTLVVPLESRLDDFPAEMSDAQWDRHDAYFEAALERLKAASHDGPIAEMDTLSRAGVSALRIAALFSLIECAEAGIDLSMAKRIKCSDRSLTAALGLVETYLEHSHLLRKLYKGEPLIHIQGRRTREQLLGELPCEFTTAEAKEAGERLGVSTATVERWLRESLKRGQLVQPTFGKYKKPG